MKIGICITQCFDSECEIVVNNGIIDDSLVSLVLNPYDEVAVEGALRLKDEGIAQEIIVLSVGSEKVTDALMDALAMGVDRGILVLNEAELDECGVARSLADVLKQEQPDLIMTGHISSDFASAQVPLRIAEELNIPHVSAVLSLKVDGENVLCDHAVDGGVATTRVKLPALVSTQIALNKPRYRTMKGIIQANRKTLKIIKNVPVKSSVKLLHYELPPKKVQGLKVKADMDPCVELLTTWMRETLGISTRG